MFFYRKYRKDTIYRLHSNVYKNPLYYILLLNNIGEQVRKELEDSSSVYTLYVAPLLFESNGDQICSRVLIVDVPIEIQISRTCSRDKVSIEQVEKIINSQISRKERLEKADDIISNDGTIEEMEAAVDKLHKKYLELTNK